MSDKESFLSKLFTKQIFIPFLVLGVFAFSMVIALRKVFFS